MKSVELIDAFLDTYGLVRHKGDSCEPLLPFIIMDTAYQQFDSIIKPIKCRFELNKEKKAWIQNYNAFNKEMFKALKEDKYVDNMIDKMEEFESYIANHITITKVQLMNCMPDDTIEMQEVLSTCILIKYCIQLSLAVWEKIYKDIDDRLNGYYCYMKHMDRHIYNFLQMYHNKYSNTHIKVTHSKEVDNAVDVLCTKTIAWLKNN